MPTKQEPLTESYFYILLCLYEGPKHGYGIMQETLRLSDGKVKIGSGTMYGATGNMLKKGWIIEKISEDSEDNRKRRYELTPEGKEIIQKEVLRLRNLVEKAEEIGL